MSQSQVTSTAEVAHVRTVESGSNILQDHQRTRVRRAIWIASATTSLLGGTLIALALGLRIDAQNQWVAHAFTRIGEIVLTTGIVTGLYEGFANARYLGVIRELFADELQPLREEVPKLEDGIEKLQKTVEIARGAIESGITAVYSNRREALEQIDAHIKAARTDQVVRLVGISLGDFLCPHGILYGTVREILKDPKKSVRFEALLIDHASDVAHQRARREEPDHFADGGAGYGKTKCNNELKTATDVAEDYAKKYPGRFEYQTYDVAPLCFVVEVGDTMFVEPYHYAGRGGEAPMMRISAQASTSGPIIAQTSTSGPTSRLFSIYQQHFKALWTEPVDRDA